MKRSILDIVGHLPQISSLRNAQDAIDELTKHGIIVVFASEVTWVDGASLDTMEALQSARRAAWKEKANRLQHQ